MTLIDALNADEFSALGEHTVLVVEASSWVRPDAPIQSVVIGVDRNGDLPPCDPVAFDLLLTVAPDPPRPWVSMREDQFDALANQVRQTPLAASILCQVLRLGEKLAFDDALMVESLAYSALLGGQEFQCWLETRPNQPVPEQEDLISIDRRDDHITATLNNPDQHNVMTAAMRDALFGALANILDDPTCPSVSLRGAGKCFSIGGSLLEFGSANDLAQAHLIRTLHSCTRLIHVLGPRVDVHFHGACVGSGLEIPAAAARRTASSAAWFQLPELKMGLIPGAGGTVSVARAIGRHRFAWMVLSGNRIGAKQALNWGLVHEISDP
jgi:hypothetical protein